MKQVVFIALVLLLLGGIYYTMRDITSIKTRFGKMKKAAVLLFIILFMVVIQYAIMGETFKTSYGTILPPGLPREIPVIAGEILSSRKTVNVYGHTAYYIQIETNLDISDVLGYYNNEFRKAGNEHVSIRKISELDSEEIYQGEGFFGKNHLLMEIGPRGTATHINLVVHLGK